MQKKGIQPIIGLDVDFISKLNHKSRLTFLCKNDIGFKNLNILSTKINTENEFYLSLDNINDCLYYLFKTEFNCKSKNEYEYIFLNQLFLYIYFKI